MSGSTLLDTLQLGGTPSRLYHAIRMATVNGAGGLVRRDMQKMFKEIPDPHIDNHLRLLKVRGFVRQVAGRGSAFVADVECKQPVVDMAELTDRVHDYILECPAGVARTVLAQELRVGEHEVYFAALPLVQDTKVSPIYMPPQHGGGIGYQVFEPCA